jgi:hypothetical protein
LIKFVKFFNFENLLSLVIASWLCILINPLYSMQLIDNYIRLILSVVVGFIALTAFLVSYQKNIDLKQSDLTTISFIIDGLFFGSLSLLLELFLIYMCIIHDSPLSNISHIIVVPLGISLLILVFEFLKLVTFSAKQFFKHLN